MLSCPPREDSGERRGEVRKILVMLKDLTPIDDVDGDIRILQSFVDVAKSQEIPGLRDVVDVQDSRG